jgi:hypothetical protein
MESYLLVHHTRAPSTLHFLFFFCPRYPSGIQKGGMPSTTLPLSETLYGYKSNVISISPLALILLQSAFMKPKPLILLAKTVG